MEDATLIDVAISQLVPSKRNVRKSKSTKDADQELLAGIRAEGLLQNLVVIQNGKPGVFEVVAGKRRLKALQQLVKEGHFEQSHPVPCRFYADAANAEEISLIENTQRLRMHPADEFEACRKMQRNGKSVDDIAASLGIPESTVKKRLKLGQVAPDIIRAYRNEEIQLDAVMAFTIEDDKARQLEVFEALKAEGWLHSPYKIREALRGETETSKGRLAKFVGSKAYTKAGGQLTNDLFQEVEYFIDRDILVDCAIKKLNQAAKKIEPDWNWIEITVDPVLQLSMKRIEKFDGPETAKLRQRALDAQQKMDQLEESDADLDHDEWHEKHGEHFERLEQQFEKVDAELVASMQYRPKEMALAGCLLTIGDNGKLKVIEGLVRNSDEKALKALQTPDTGPDSAGESSNSSSSSSTTSNDSSSESDTISQSLHDDLTTYRLNIAKRFIAIGGENDARDLLYYTLCMQTLNTHYWGSPLSITITETRPASSLKKPDTGRALQELQEHHDTELQLDWMSIEDPAERFTAFIALDMTEKLNLMAYCVAQSLVAGLSDRSIPEVEVALKSLDIPWHKYFQPTADNYLGRITKPMLLELGEQFFSDYAAEGADKRTKKQLAEDLEAVLAGNDDTMPADKRAEAIDWIPAGFKPL